MSIIIQVVWTLQDGDGDGSRVPSSADDGKKKDCNFKVASSKTTRRKAWKRGRLEAETQTDETSDSWLLPGGGRV